MQHSTVSVAIKTKNQAVASSLTSYVTAHSCLTSLSPLSLYKIRESHSHWEMPFRIRWKTRVHASLPTGVEAQLHRDFHSDATGRSFAVSRDGISQPLVTRWCLVSPLQMVHKAVVEVDESGTKAAAATEVTFAFRSALMSSQTIMFNRPFLMFIVENAENILFFGKVTHP